MRVFIFNLIINLITLPSMALEASELPKNIQDSVFLINSTGGCASGFFTTGGLFITNFHVARGACNAKLCYGFELSKRDQSSGKTELYKKIDFNVVALFPFADLAILEPTQKEIIDPDTGKLEQYEGTPRDNTIDTKVVSGIAAELHETSSGSALISVGFPGCKDLTVTHHAVSEVKTFELEAKPSVIKGASGGPVFNENFQLVGIVSRNSFGESTVFPYLKYLTASLEQLSQNSIAYDMQLHLDDFWRDRKISDISYKDILTLNSLSNGLLDSGYILNQLDICPDLKDFFFYIKYTSIAYVLPPDINSNKLNLLCSSIFKRSYMVFMAMDYLNSYDGSSTFDKFRQLDFNFYYDLKQDLSKNHQPKVIELIISVLLIVLIQIIIIFLFSFKIGKILLQKYALLDKISWPIIIIFQLIVIIASYFIFRKFF